MNISASYKSDSDGQNTADRAEYYSLKDPSTLKLYIVILPKKSVDPLKVIFIYLQLLGQSGKFTPCSSFESLKSSNSAIVDIVEILSPTSTTLKILLNNQPTMKLNEEFYLTLVGQRSHLEILRKRNQF